MSRELAYPVTLTPDEADGGFVVTFQDVPEAITQGDDHILPLLRRPMLWRRLSRAAFGGATRSQSRLRQERGNSSSQYPHSPLPRPPSTWPCGSRGSRNPS
jgi:hypothetical protein